MQTLWTRVAQVRASCHCPQCVSSTTTRAVARRAAATATRRAPRFWTSSTVWYSGIFAVAATLDLGVKQQRREQWNKAIADVKQDLKRCDDDTDSDANRAFLDSLEDDTVASTEMRQNLDSSVLRDNTPEWPASTGQDRQTNKLPPQSIYMDNRKKAKHMLDRWMPKKLERVQLSIDALQLEFFMELHRHGWHEEAASAVPAWYAEQFRQPSKEIQKALDQKHQDLHKVYHMKGKYSFGGEDEQAGQAVFASWKRSEGDVPLCSYGQDELGKFHATAYDLNRTLRNLFDMGRNRTLSQPAVLAKVYHNLSVSSAPPNIDTFNTLIVGLSDIGTRRLVEDCINALECSKLRHNEVSLASILNYWTLTGNEQDFQYWVQLMRGEWGGLSLAQPGVGITESSQGRLRRKDKGVKVIQRPSPTPMVFGAMIKGVTKFSGFDAALGVCEAAREEGWGLCIGGLHPLLKDCSRRRDWDAGLATWKQIQALRSTKTKRFENGTWKWRVPSIDLPTFASMLQLCTRCNNRTAFQDIMEQAIVAHPGSAKDLIRMVRAERSEMQTSDRDHETAARNLKPTTDITHWLEKQNVHQYTDALKDMSWQKMTSLDDTSLKSRGVADASTREKLLEILRQVRETTPPYNNTSHSWIVLANQRHFRLQQLRKRRKTETRLELEIDESLEWNVVQPREEHNQQAPHDELQLAQPLERADELDRPVSHAVSMALIPNHMQNAYQPFGV